MTIGRDILKEAQDWRTEVLRRGNAALGEALEPLTEVPLIMTYHLWWQTYSDHIRRAPSNRPGEGVSKHDATRAGQLATDAVLSYVNDYWKESE